MKLSNKQVTASKTMSYALRHRPEEFGLVLDKGGVGLTSRRSVRHWLVIRAALA